MTVALSPYVSTLFDEVEGAIRQIFGFKPNVDVRRRPSPRGWQRAIDFTVQLPNDLSFDFRLADPAAMPEAWQKSAHLHLNLLSPPDQPHPTDDPAAAPSVQAIAKLFQAHQHAHGPEHTAALWEAYAPVAAWSEIDDAYYRRVFYGDRGVSANVRVGFRCNQDCHFCWQGRQWPEPPAEMYATWLDELGRAGVKQLILTGGEPTLYKSLPDLIHTARHTWGMWVMLQTNAIQLRKPKLLERLHVDRLFVSFHAADPDISDKMTRAPGTFWRTVEGIEAALAAGLPVSLNCLVEQANHQVLAQHAAFIVERFVQPFPDNPVSTVTYSRPQTYYDSDLHRDSLAPLDAIRPHILPAVRTLLEAGVHPDVTTGSCALAPCLFHVEPQLIVLQQPEHIGQADPAWTRDRRPAPCQRCALADHCQGPGQGYQATFGERGLLPFDEVPAVLRSA